jgi:pimeloyl-ACP methyl ester carboxylesterase
MLLLLCTVTIKAQVKKTKIYLIHGQGSDARLFSKLTLNVGFDTFCLNLPLPAKGENMQSFAQQLIPKIDTTGPFILIGVSLGGMVAAELNDILHPLQTIIISSAKNNNELPTRYKFMHAFPLYKVFPAGFIKASSFIMQPLVEPDRKKEKAIFKSMLRKKDKHFLKRTIPMIVNWQKKSNTGGALIHIHGTKDHTIPIKNINTGIVIKNGSHMMVLTQAELISEKINEILLSLNLLH